MIEPMDIDQNGVSGQATPDESITESSVKGEDTPESTDVPATPQPCTVECLLTIQDGSVHVRDYPPIPGQWAYCR